MKPFSRWEKISNLTLRVNVFDKNTMQTLLTLANHCVLASCLLCSELQSSPQGGCAGWNAQKADTEWLPSQPRTNNGALFRGERGLILTAALTPSEVHMNVLTRENGVNKAPTQTQSTVCSRDINKCGQVFIWIDSVRKLLVTESP